MRVNKYLAMCGVGSRRSVEELILLGKVKVNGGIITNLATDIKDTDLVTVNNKPVKAQTNKVYIMLNKPNRVVSTSSDPEGRTTVIDVIKQNPKQYKDLISTTRLYPVGRLDYNTTGLLILTNDGDLTLALTHPSTKVDKTYIATVDRPIMKSELETLSSGVKIDGVKTAPASFEYVKHDRMKIKVVIHEGRNRQVRKMFETIGANVKTLARIKEGNLELGNLSLGDWKFIRKNQIV